MLYGPAAVVANFFSLWLTFYFVAHFFITPQRPEYLTADYSTVTDFARLRGLSTSVPRASAVW
jgi:hypothetical protein